MPKSPEQNRMPHDEAEEEAVEMQSLVDIGLSHDGAEKEIKLRKETKEEALRYMEIKDSMKKEVFRKAIESLKNPYDQIEGYEEVSPSWYVVKGKIEKAAYPTQKGGTAHWRVDAYAKVGEKYIFMPRVLEVDTDKWGGHPRYEEVEENQIPKDKIIQYPPKDIIIGRRTRISYKICPAYANHDKFKNGPVSKFDFFASLCDGDVLIKSNCYELKYIDPVFYKKI